MRLRLPRPLIPLLVALCAGVLSTLPRTAHAQRVFINEVMASNDATLQDPDFGSPSDWIELVNLEEYAVDLTAFSITDDLDNPTKWRFPPGTKIPRDGHLLIWADDEEQGVHTNFKLSAGGEAVGLYSPSGAVVDTLTFGEQETDISLGRYPEASGPFVFFAEATPGAPNTTEPADGVAAPPTVSVDGGFYDRPQTVALALPAGSAPGAIIRYTRDGSPPVASSQLYTGPISFTETGVLRAIVFAPGRIASSVVSRTYLLNVTSTLPVVTLVTDPDNFFDDEIGIYVRGTNGITGRCSSSRVNWNQDWERPVHVSLYEPDGTVGFSTDAGIKIFGGCSRLYPQKSLVLKARSRYGADAFEHKIFPDIDVDRFDDLVLRSSAQDWYRTMFRDGLIQTLARLGMDDLDAQAYRPAIVFLNGEYWGIHNLREQMNNDWAAAHYDLDDEAVELIDAAKVKLGGRSGHYDALLDFLGANGLDDDDAFAHVAKQIDTEEYLNYVIAQIYSANSDWPGNNLKLWRPLTEEGRWRWMLFDTDFGFGGNGNGEYSDNTLALATDPNGPEWPNPPWSTYLLRKLLENDGFRHAFIQRMAAHANTTYDPDHVLGVIDSLQTRIAPEIPRHKARWEASISFGRDWDALVEIMREFARLRPAAIRSHMRAQFSEVVGSARLNLRHTEGGRIWAAGVMMPPGDTSPIFYRGAPLDLVAVPAPGYRFVGWSGSISDASDSLSLMLTGEMTLNATFALGTDADVPADRLASSLGESHPNPATGQAHVEVTLAEGGRFTLRLYDLLGREVAVLADEDRPAGSHRIAIETDALPSGVYVYALEAGAYRAARRMVVLK